MYRVRKGDNCPKRALVIIFFKDIGADIICLPLIVSLQPIQYKYDYGTEKGVRKVSGCKGVLEQVVQHSCDAVRTRYG